MTNRFKKFLMAYLCIALVLVLAAGSFFGIGIWTSVRRIADNPYMDDSWYYGLDNAAYTISEAISQGQRNLFLTNAETFSAPDPEDLSVEFAIRLMPFEIAAGSSATAFVRGVPVALTLRDGVLEGSARVPIASLAWDDDEGSLEYRVLLQSGGVQKNQWVSPGFYLGQGPALGWIDSYWDTPYNGRLNLIFDYELYDAYAPFGDTIASANIYALTYTYGAYAYGEGLERAQDRVFSANFEDGALELEKTFEVGDDQLLRFYAEVVGESGMVYRYWLQDFVSPTYESEWEFPWFDEDYDARVSLYIEGNDTQAQAEFW